MATGRKRRDNNLIDAIEAIDPVQYTASVWRVVRKDKDPTQCSRSGGRWDDGTFNVLYTSEKAKGAIAEMRFHLMRGQPVMPSMIIYHLYEIDVSLKRSLKLLDLRALQNIGMDASRFGQLSYQNKAAEYPQSQDIGEVAHFLEYDGLIVPNARYDCLNVVAFCDRIPPDALDVKSDHGEVKWNEKS